MNIANDGKREKATIRKQHIYKFTGAIVRFKCVKCGKEEEIILVRRKKSSRTVCNSCQKERNKELQRKRYYGK